MVDYVVTEVLFGEGRVRAAALYGDMKLQELRVENAAEASLVGKIYRGTVDRIAGNIGGCFVKIGDKSAFLPKNDGGTVKSSQPILVQVTKDAAGIKEPVLTTNLHLSGEYAVLSLKGGRTSFSKKLGEEDKALVRKWLRDRETSDFHLLVRTNALRAGKEALLKEISRLTITMKEILAEYPHAASGTLLYEPEPFYLTMLRDTYTLPDRAITDIPLFREQIGKLMECSLYGRDKMSLTLPQLYGLSQDLLRLTQKKVWLKSGGFLVIEKTEAFVSVDVNTGKCCTGKIPEETYRKINKEAAEELSRQLRLRNLSGMILVDFIKMNHQDHREELLGIMRKLVKKDHIHTEVVDLTALGIMEIVRQKVRKPLAEELSVC